MLDILHKKTTTIPSEERPLYLVNSIYSSTDLLLIRIDLVGLLVEFAIEIEMAIFMSIIPIENIDGKLNIDVSIIIQSGSCICVSLQSSII